ncbi:MAG: ABC transporter ATP-binding protein [Turicibacter sp.]|nr:ABC transporter ATP-binding protein [Turicibacter sp.]
MLEVKGFTKQYGTKTAAKNISFSVGAGEIVGFIGHNGAGKTTTLKCVAGINPISNGEILIDGTSIKQDAVACKRVTAFVPDTPSLYPYLTGSQYLNLIADIYQVDSKLRKERMEKMAEDFEISHAMGSLIGTYSHGMQQKIALMAAFIHEPKLLILDEPFVGLDPAAFITLKSMMTDLCQKGGAVLFSSHVLDVVEKLCQKLVIIRKGEIVATGNTADIIGNVSLESVFMEMNAHD